METGLAQGQIFEGLQRQDLNASLSSSGAGPSAWGPPPHRGGRIGMVVEEGLADILQGQGSVSDGTVLWMIQNMV